MTDSIRDIYQQLQNDYELGEKRIQDSYFVLFRLYRQLCFPLAAVFLRYGVTANTVTVLGFMLLMLAFAFISLGTKTGFVIGAFVYFFAFILDFVDGTIARFVNKPNYFGKMIDGLVDYFSHLIYFFVGIGLFSQGGFDCNGAIWLVLGAGVSILVHLLLYFRIRVAYFANETETSSTPSSQDERESASVNASHL